MRVPGSLLPVISRACILIKLNCSGGNAQVLNELLHEPQFWKETHTAHFSEPKPWKITCSQ